MSYSVFSGKITKPVILLTEYKTKFKNDSRDQFPDWIAFSDDEALQKMLVIRKVISFLFGIFQNLDITPYCLVLNVLFYVIYKTIMFSRETNFGKWTLCWE